MKRVKELLNDSYTTTFVIYGDCCVIDRLSHIKKFNWENRDGYKMVRFVNFVAILYEFELYLLSKESFEVIKELGIREGLNVLKV